LFTEAYEKYQRVVEIKPDDYIAWNNWGYALSEQARKKEGDEADRLFTEACDKLRKALEIEPDMYEAWNNWGRALSRQADKKDGNETDRLVIDAYKKLQRAIAIKPDGYEAWNNWGYALSHQAQRKRGQEKNELLRNAREKLLKAEQMKKGWAAYNLACAAAIEGNEEECKKWLKIDEEAGTLETREYAMKDDDLKMYRDKDWFKAIKWKGEK
jgi:cytochrome c-type biogenesis protein CcmH/NrfG